MLTLMLKRVARLSRVLGLQAVFNQDSKKSLSEMKENKVYTAQLFRKRKKKGVKTQARAMMPNIDPSEEF